MTPGDGRKVHLNSDATTTQLTRLVMTLRERILNCSRIGIEIAPVYPKFPLTCPLPAS